MVWGLVEPSTFGDFFPDGDYVGWEERLSKYLHEEMTPEQRAIYGGVDVNYRYEVSRKFTEEMDKLAPHECPAEFKIEKTPKSLGSLLILNDRLLAVDEPLKHLIEELEPEIHQFWPLRITLPRGNEYPTPYYGMVIRTFIDSFMPNQSSNFESKYESKIFYANKISKECFSGLVVSSNIINARHFWCEKKLSSPKYCISDNLQSAIALRGLRIFKHYKLKAI